MKNLYLTTVHARCVYMFECFRVISSQVHLHLSAVL